MPVESGQTSNIDRLLAHLDDGSLAARLVRAHRDSEEGGTAEGLKAVLSDRLEQMRAKLDGGAD